jgi:hypothetical protein
MISPLFAIANLLFSYRSEGLFFTEEMTPIVRGISMLDSKWQKYTPIPLACNSPQLTLLERLLKPQ